MNSRYALMATVAASALAALAPSISNAAEAASEVQEVVITGSRIQTAGFQAPTPVTVVTAEQLTNTAPGTIAEAIALLPSMRFTGPQDTRSGTQGGSGGAYLNLRGLGSVRTLTLLDGRRVVGGTSSGQVDANLLPTSLLERVDVVTGGASAAYGSDAVAGVVNFVLNKRYQGWQADAQYGLSTYGDNEEVKLNGAFGTAFGPEGKGHFLISGEHYNSEGVACQCHRPVERESYGIITNPAYTPTNGLHRRIVVKDTKNTATAYTGIITTAGPLQNLTFDDNGNTRPVQFGSIVSGATSVGGDEVLSQGADFTIQSAPNHHSNVFGRLSWDLNDKVTVYAEGIYSYTRVYFSNGNSDSQGTSALIIRRDNPYLPANVVQIMTANNIQSFRLGRSYTDLPSKDTYQRNWTQRYVTGADFDFGNTWKGDIYAEYGVARNSARVPGNLNQNRMFLAMDAVRAPNGAIVCRSTLTDPNNGCVPYNPLGLNRASSEAKKWVVGESNSLARIQQNVVAASVNGQPFELWAGPVAVAFGAEARLDKFKANSDVVSQSINSFTGTVGGWRNANPQPQQGRVTVKEAFGEVDIPLADGMTFAKELNFNAAARRTDYSTSGGVTSWKLGLQWKPVDDLRFRATRSRDIRAPNINELFLGGNQQFTQLNDPFKGGTPIGNVRQITRGNPNLVPEIAKTWAVGMVFQPAAIRGFSSSIDLYKIDIGGAIATTSPQITLDQCFGGSVDACKAVNRDAAGNLTGIDLYPRNLQSLQTEGVDFEVQYRLPPTMFSIPGALTLALRGTYVAKLATTDPGGLPVDRAGDVRAGSQPQWRTTTSVNWDLGKVSLNLQGRFVGGGRLDTDLPSTPTIREDDIDIYSVAGQFYVDARLAYEFREGMEIFAASSNLFNNKPPIPPNSTVYDSVGRMVRVGVRLRQ